MNSSIVQSDYQCWVQQQWVAHSRHVVKGIAKAIQLKKVSSKFLAKSEHLKLIFRRGVCYSGFLFLAKQENEEQIPETFNI